ncbi:MAG TPA: hypothetical protein VJP81_07665 [Candidatus Dormibacteraeota bacterium]|nr:hypothetical protein [Candidatus Dormibacteraeota bacterium]
MTTAPLRLTSACFVVAGLLFVLYPTIRPFSDETSLQGAAAFGSNAWVVSHSLAIVGFMLLALGMLGVYLALQRTPVEALMLVAVGLTWVGIGLTLPFYGAEVFGLHAIGQAALSRHDASLVALASDVRGEPGIWFIVIGLLLLGVGIVFFAIAAWRSGILVPWIGIPLAVGFALYLPQFTAPQLIRMLHGLFITMGCGLVGWNLRTLAPHARLFSSS